VEGGEGEELVKEIGVGEAFPWDVVLERVVCMTTW
jgi:hypothetical protein